VRSSPVVAFTIANVSMAIPPVTSSAAQGFGRGTSCPWTRGSIRQPIKTAISPIGTLIKKIHRQLSVTSKPPIGGPSAAANPPIAVHARTAPARLLAGEDASRRPRDVGVMSAAPAAWTTRKVTSVSTLFAIAHAADAAVNSATLTRKLRSRR
jgi:hypothetical protein